jgi:hypothetical protein
LRNRGETNIVTRAATNDHELLLFKTFEPHPSTYTVIGSSPSSYALAERGLRDASDGKQSITKLIDVSLLGGIA